MTITTSALVAGILLEVAKGLIVAGFQQARLAGMKDEEIIKYAAEIHEQFQALPSATTLPEIK